MQYQTNFDLPVCRQGLWGILKRWLFSLQALPLWAVFALVAMANVANVRFALPGISAAYCVRCALAGMRRHKTVIVPGPLMAAGMAMSHLVPRGVLIRMAEYQQKRKISR